MKSTSAHDTTTHNTATRLNSLSSIVSSIKQYEKIILSKRANDKDGKFDTSELGANDGGRLMEEILLSKMSAEAKKSLGHATAPGNQCIRVLHLNANIVDNYDGEE